MKSWCERDEHGREVGVTEHDGHQLRALGSSVVGDQVAGYYVKGPNRWTGILKTWCGKVMMECRAEQVEEYRSPDGDKTFGVAFQLKGGRFIVGYCLGEGMLFRGELVRARDAIEARRICESVCDYWQRVDQEDHDRAEYESEFEDLDESDDWELRSEC
jgi:hypothetical protein